MLLNLNKVNWSNALKNKNFEKQAQSNLETMQNMKRLVKEYNKWI